MMGYGGVGEGGQPQSQPEIEINSYVPTAPETDDVLVSKYKKRFV